MGSCMGHGRKNQGREMTDRTHPDSGRIVTSGDVINDLHDEIAQLRGTRKVLWNLLGECLPVIDALMQVPGDDDSDAHLNGLAGRINDARITELESQLAQRFDAADVATAAAQGFRDGVASVSTGSASMASYAIRLLVAAALITQAKSDEALLLAAEITAALGPAGGESNE